MVTTTHSPLPPRPFILTTGLLVFLLLDLAVLGVAATVLLGDHFDGDGAIGTVLGGSLIAGGVILLVETWRSSRGKRSARKTLTYVGVMLAILFVWRRLIPFLLLAILAAIGLALIWSPQSNAYFQAVEPRHTKLRGYARATSKAAQSLRKK